MILYHGTTKENGDQIIKDGVINGPVYLTPDIIIAEEYAGSNAPDFIVFEINVDRDQLVYDAEFVKCGEGDWLRESLENGSAYTENNVSISDCETLSYTDYELNN